MTATTLAADNQSAPLKDDPLLGCLEILCQKEKIPFNEKEILSGIPLVDNCLTPSLFVRAAKWVNLKSKIVYRSLEKIPELVLPVVLVLKDNKACVLTKIDKDIFTVVFPDAPKVKTKMKRAELDALFTGYAIFVQHIHDYDERAKQYQQVMRGSWFWRTIWRFRSIYFHVILAALLINLFTLATPLFIMNVYDRVVPNFAVETLWALTVGIIALFTFDLILRSLRSYLIDSAGQKIDILLASTLFRHVLGMKLTGKPESAGAFANNLRDFDNLREFFTSATLTTIVDVPFIFLFIVIIAYIGGAVAWIPFVATPIVIIATYFFEAPMRRAIESAKTGAAQKHAILTESISGLETIKILSAEGSVLSKWEHYVKMVAKAAVRSRFFSALAANFTIYIQHLVTVLIVVFGVYMIANGTLTVGGLIACVILSGRALAPLGQITNILTRFELSRLALSNLNQVMAQPQERPKANKFLSRTKIRGEIEFSNLTFSYPDQPVCAIEGLNIRIKEGEKVGLIGRIGAGKSTLVKLCLGLYPIGKGAVRVDGADIAQIDPADLRQNIGYCAQSNRLFYGSIRENILLGRDGITDEKILRFAKIAGVDSFIARHPAGYDLQVGEAGDGLSGGQQQAVNLARALVTEPKIVILDEPTSAMDTTTEQELIQSLKTYFTDQTLLLATHRPSLLQLVDRIIVLNDGKVAADGPRDEVMNILTGKDKP